MRTKDEPYKIGFELVLKDENAITIRNEKALKLEWIDPKDPRSRQGVRKPITKAERKKRTRKKALARKSRRKNR